MSPPQISFVTIGVKDLQRSRRFYEGMGWTASTASSESLVYFLSQRSMLALYDETALATEAGVPGEGEGFRKITLSQNVGSKSEVGATLSRALALGAQMTRAPRDTSWGGYAGWFADPDGHLWEVVWNPKWSMDTAFAAGV